MASYLTRCCLRRHKLFCTLTSKNLSTQQTQTVTKVDKSLLTKLKKQTGFSFFKCSNALKLANNNFVEAEEWLNKQAEAEGWSKAQKLQTRTTGQGLVGVLTEGNFAALVEVNCETDFVARNDLFRELVSIVSRATINFRRSVIEQNMRVNSLATDVSHLREVLMTHDLQQLRVPDLGLTIEEYTVGLVGKIGENIKLKKALAIATGKDNIIGASSHGNGSTTYNNVHMGTYCAAVVLKPLNPAAAADSSHTSSLARSLSQHVIGMNPKCLDRTEDIAEEDTLLCQEFLLDDSKRIGDLVKEAGVEIVDFVRYSVEA